MLALAFTPDAYACKWVDSEAMVIDGEPDGIAPPTPELQQLHVGRGKDRGPFGGWSCDPYASLTIEFVTQDFEEDYGYEIELIEGDYPFDSPLYIVGDSTQMYYSSAYEVQQLHFGWSELGEANEAPWDFTLSIRAIDHGGDVSDPVEVVIEDRGRRCGIADGTGSGFLLALLPLLGLARRRL